MNEPIPEFRIGVRERLRRPGHGFARGLVVALPLAALAWGLIAWLL